ncbi:formate dehydrogenase subunit gamma [Candidatus Endobugula sertula]|uniref:NADH-quinone oxidoreductase subunit E n=1 Tax=Candidatus Endobugula sertula TaxID=62101 RepID=A0A1D2QP02_9GAMM|nr:formate dehydrogenase subunit gamma [Candidatus Endobugula sertula]
MNHVQHWGEQAQKAVAAILDAHQKTPSSLLPILHDIQDQLGYVPAEAVEEIAAGLNLSRAEVHGVVSFYRHFSTKPRGRHIVEVCCAESCQAVGGRIVEAHAKATLGVDWYQTTRDGEITLEPVYCLGNCACSPSVRVGKQVLGRMTTERFDRLVENLGTVAVEVQ